MEYKPLVSYFLQEIKAENEATRKCIERIPESAYNFKPHEKSMELRYLLLLVAEIPRWVASIITDTVINFQTYGQYEVTDTAALVKHYDDNIKSAIKALENITEEQLKPDFELKNGDQLLYATPKLKAIGETINHWVHHRGQLTVYMRMKDIAVPSIYGPSADEQKY